MSNKVLVVIISVLTVSIISLYMLINISSFVPSNSQVLTNSEVKVIEKSNDKKEKERLTLIAIIANNNAAIIKYGHSKQDVIFINADWTIDKLPKHVALSKKDEEFLRRFLKK